jgi:hypothetical protein
MLGNAVAGGYTRPEQWRKVVRKLELEGKSLTRPPKVFCSEHPFIEDLSEPITFPVEGVDGGSVCWRCAWGEGQSAISSRVAVFFLCLEALRRRFVMADIRVNKGVVALAFAIGGIVGVCAVRAFFLDSVEEVGWRMFWSSLGGRESIDMATVLQSTTFAKCTCGFLLVGAGAAFVTWFASTRRLNSN